MSSSLSLSVYKNDEKRGGGGGWGEGPLYVSRGFLWLSEG